MLLVQEISEHVLGIPAFFVLVAQHFVQTVRSSLRKLQPLEQSESANTIVNVKCWDVVQWRRIEMQNEMNK